MKEIIMDVVAIVVPATLIPIIGYIGAKLAKYLNSKISDDKTKQIMEDINSIIVSNVRAITQSYVEDLKKYGRFDNVAKSNALERAKSKIMSELSNKEKTYLNNKYKDVNKWIESQIESTIYSIKK
jgi:archaellum component FlaG (FlaF/FlaG flagellin family)